MRASNDSVFIPVITAAETDARVELLDHEQLSYVEQSMRDIIEDLGTRPPMPAKMAADRAEAADDDVPAPAPALAPNCRVYCLPARADRDEPRWRLQTSRRQKSRRSLCQRFRTPRADLRCQFTSS